VLADIAKAFQDRQYLQAEALIKALEEADPSNPWLLFYQGYQQELAENWSAAETLYRQLLQEVSQPKLVEQARQGLQRLLDLEHNRRQLAIASALASPDQGQQGLLVLEPIPAEQKTSLATRLARIMGIDPYTARLILPTRSWRPFRIGSMGELGVYGQELAEASIPAFWVKLADLTQIEIYQVESLPQLPHGQAIGQTSSPSTQQIEFAWSQVAQRVEGKLPIFTQVLERTARGKWVHKEHTQDYAHVYDLHLIDQGCILRFCDQTFRSRADALKQEQHTTAQEVGRSPWQQLLHQVNQQLSHTPLWSDFNPFATSVLDQKRIVGNLTAHIPLQRQLRKGENDWDPAFQLYSTLAFWRYKAQR
jgi:hypothetical protein